LVNEPTARMRISSSVSVKQSARTTAPCSPCARSFPMLAIVASRHVLAARLSEGWRLRPRVAPNEIEM
jgi:hypothetical protein